MRDALIIFVAIILSVVVGGYLYLNGGPAFTGEQVSIIEPRESFVVLAEGQNSGAVDRRTNFRIMNDEELNELWSLIYGNGGTSVPPVDFSKYEVIAVFDGSHSTSGYRVDVTDVIDADGKRTIAITRSVPTADCMVASALTSPFQIIRVSKTALPLAKEETQKEVCGR